VVAAFSKGVRGLAKYNIGIFFSAFFVRHNVMGKNCCSALAFRALQGKKTKKESLKFFSRESAPCFGSSKVR